MTVEGANPEQLDRLANDLRQLAEAIDARRNWLTGWIELDRFWRGNRANEFRHRWEHEYSPQLRAAVENLHRGVERLHANANQQRVASGEQPKNYGASGFVDQLFGDAWAAVDAIAAAVPSGPPDAMHGVLRDVGTALVLGGAADFVAELSMIRGLTAAGNDLATLGKALDFVESGKVFGPVAKVLGAAGLVFDGATLWDDVVSHKGLTLDVMLTGVDVAACFNPYVLAGKSAYDVTNWFLTDTPAGKHFVDANSSAVVDFGASQVGGDPYADPTAASRLAHRYDGVRGFGNYMHDEFFSMF